MLHMPLFVMSTLAVMMIMMMVVVVAVAAEVDGDGDGGGGGGGGDDDDEAVVMMTVVVVMMMMVVVVVVMMQGRIQQFLRIAAVFSTSAALPDAGGRSCDTDGAGQGGQGKIWRSPEPEMHYTTHRQRYIESSEHTAVVFTSRIVGVSIEA